MVKGQTAAVTAHVLPADTPARTRKGELCICVCTSPCCLCTTALSPGKVQDAELINLCRGETLFPCWILIRL